MAFDSPRSTLPRSLGAGEAVMRLYLSQGEGWPMMLVSSRPARSELLNIWQDSAAIGDCGCRLAPLPAVAPWCPVRRVRRRPETDFRAFGPSSVDRGHFTAPVPPDGSDFFSSLASSPL